MSKIKKVEYIEDGKLYKTQFLYWCLGCGYEHAFSLKENGGYHIFNMDLENPTVSPSLLQNFVPGKLCHSFIIDGKIQYLNDCDHKLAGQIIDIPEYPI
jgi:hypothetical protein